MRQPLLALISMPVLPSLGIICLPPASIITMCEPLAGLPFSCCTAQIFTVSWATVGVGVGFGVDVSVGVGSGVGVLVGRGVAVGEGVAVGMGVAVGRGVLVGGSVAVGAGVSVDVGLGAGLQATTMMATMARLGRVNWAKRFIL